MYINSFMNKIRELVKIGVRQSKKNEGFTLIEAIISVAIVGIVVAPIAMIFQGALQSSMETRVQLKANELAQQYIEAFKILSYEDLKTLSDAGGKVTYGVTPPYNLPEVIEGFEIQLKLRYDEATDSQFNEGFGTLDVNNNFKMPSDLLSAGLSVIDSDFILSLNSAINNDTKIKNRAGGETELFQGSVSEDDRNIVISCIKDPLGIKYEVKDTLKAKSWSITYESFYSHNIEIVCNDIVGGASIKNTTIQIENSTDTMLNVYVLETSQDTIKPSVNNKSGKITIFRNISSKEVTSHRLYEFEVNVIKDSEIITTVITTVIAN